VCLGCRRECARHARSAVHCVCRALLISEGIGFGGVVPLASVESCVWSDGVCCCSSERSGGGQRITMSEWQIDCFLSVVGNATRSAKGDFEQLSNGRPNAAIHHRLTFMFLQH
jgi:hypothetical protein